MSLTTCLQFGFACKETIEQKEKDITLKLSQAKVNKTNLETEIKNLQTESIELDNLLIQNEHYSFLYNDLPPLHECGIKVTEDTSNKFATYFGLSQTSFPTTNPTKLPVIHTGLGNYRIPKDLMQKLLNKYPITLYNRTEGYSDNHVMRFIGYLNISKYWNSCVFAIETKTKWVVAFWATDEDLIYYADPISKLIWLPDKNKAEDFPVLYMD